MKITIDTKEDSREDIKIAIRLLQSLVDHVSSGDSTDFPTGENVFGSILETPAESSEPEEPKEDFSIKDIQTY